MTQDMNINEKESRRSSSFHSDEVEDDDEDNLEDIKVGLEMELVNEEFEGYDLRSAVTDRNHQRIIDEDDDADGEDISDEDDEGTEEEDLEGEGKIKRARGKNNIMSMTLGKSSFKETRSVNIKSFQAKFD